ncbi:MAG: hypothetical protein AB9869_35355 [Verrucomicrobiia bacterium]
MKTTIAFLILVSFTAVSVLGQAAKPVQAPKAPVQNAEVPSEVKAPQAPTQMEVQAPPTEAKQPTVVTPAVPGPELKKRVFYGGFLTDLKRAERKRALLSLRNPIDPVKDMENLWLDPAAPNKIQGTVLFSIKF